MAKSIAILVLGLALPGVSLSQAVLVMEAANGTLLATCALNGAPVKFEIDYKGSENYVPRGLVNMLAKGGQITPSNLGGTQLPLDASLEVSKLQLYIDELRIDSFSISGVVFSVSSNSVPYITLAGKTLEKLGVVDQKGKVLSITDTKNGRSSMGERSNNELGDTHFNRGVQNFNSGRYEAAIQDFQEALQQNPADTVSMINAGIAALSVEDYENSRKYHTLALESGVTSKSAYKNLLYILFEQDQDYQQALRWVRKARGLYPADLGFNRDEFDILVELEMYTEAIYSIQPVIAKMYTDVNLWFVYANLLVKMSEASPSAEQAGSLRERALDSFDVVAGIDPDHVGAYYNMGVLLLKDTNELIRRYKSLGDSSEELRKSEEISGLIEEKMTRAIPVWEKLAVIEKDEVKLDKILSNLKNFYTQLGMTEKATLIEDRMIEEYLNSLGN